MNGAIRTVREAARLMRERAEAASGGPWTAHPDGLVWPPRIGDPVSGSTEVEDAQHIASWHPAVALAVADWLLYEASAAPLNPYALRIARAYLDGGPAR